MNVKEGSSTADREREFLLAEALHDHFEKVELLTMTLGSEIERFERGRVSCARFPVSRVYRSNKVLVSRLMKEHVLHSRPSALIYKGLGYKQTAYLVNSFHGDRPVLVGIVGGGTYDPTLQVTDLVLEEYPGQVGSGQGYDGPTKVFPKYVPDLPDERAEKEWDVISVGHLTRLKNHRAILALGRDRKVVIVGDGPERSNLEEEVRTSGLVGVTFAGRVPRAEVLRMISRARLMVHPSLSEGFPRALAEAIVSGVPVIALKSAVGYPIEENGLGWLVHEEDLCHAARKLLESPDQRKAAADRCREYGRLFLGRGGIEEIAATIASATVHGPGRLTRGDRIRHQKYYLKASIRCGLDYLVDRSVRTIGALSGA